MSPGLGALWESAINNAAQQLTLTRHLPTERNRLGLQSLAVRARYLLAPLPVCEIALVSRALLVMSVGKTLGGVGGSWIGVPVPFSVTLAQPTSYCDGAPCPWRALVLYAWLPLPPLALLTPGSLNTEPGDVAALPGEAAACPELPPSPHSAPWLASAYAGAAPTTATAIMQVTQNSLYLMFPSVSGRSPLFSGRAIVHL
jgi:hypothetical protein